MKLLTRTTATAPPQEAQGPAARLRTAVSAAIRPRQFSGERRLVASIVAMSTTAFAFASQLRLHLGSPWGDEPAYLVLSQTMQLYHSLDIMQVHSHGDYSTFYPGYLEPHIVPGADGEPRPLHQIGGPLLWLLPFAIFGRAGSVGFMVAVSVLGLVNMYYFLRERGIRQSYAGIVTAALAIGSPVYVFASMSFVEPIGALLTVFAARVIFQERSHPGRLTLASLAVAYLPWVHMRFAPLAVSLALLLVWRVWRDYGRTSFWPYVQALGPVVLSAVLIEVYTIVLYGELDPMAPQALYGVRMFDVPVYEGFVGTLFDRNYGLITNFPIFFLVLPAMLLAMRRTERPTNLILLAAIIPYTVLTVSSTTWWGSYNPPARYQEVLVPLFAWYVAFLLQSVDRWFLSTATALTAVAAYGLHLATDLYPSDRFTAWDLRPAGMARVGDLIGVDFARLAPSSFLPGQTTRFIAWIAAATAIALALWWLGARNSGWTVRGPAPAHAATETLWTRASEALALLRRTGRSRVAWSAAAVVVTAAVGGAVVIRSDQIATNAADVVGVWHNPDGGRFELRQDGTFSAVGIRTDVITYEPLGDPTPHQGAERQSASGTWRVVPSAPQVELHITMLGSRSVSIRRTFRSTDWAHTRVLYLLVAYPDSNVWYGFFQGQVPTWAQPLQPVRGTAVGVSGMA